jgi:hypothetical protein
MLAVGAATLVIAVAILIIRYTNNSLISVAAFRF